MAFTIPNGGQLQLATAIATPIAVSAASNATSCVLTTATNTYAIGDYVEVTLGWARGTNRVFRLSAATATTATLEGFDTTSTVNYPVSGGVGTVRKITTWTSLLQIKDFKFGGSEPKVQTDQFLESLSEFSYVTGNSAGFAEWMFGDDLSLTGFQAYRTVSESKAQTPLRLLLLNGGVTAMTGECFLSQNPTIDIDQIIKVSARYDIRGSVTRY